jgi:hypothetical protein
MAKCSSPHSLQDAFCHAPFLCFSAVNLLPFLLIHHLKISGVVVYVSRIILFSVFGGFLMGSSLSMLDRAVMFKKHVLVRTRCL